MSSINNSASFSTVWTQPIQRPAPSWLVSSIGNSAAPVSQRSRVRIPYKPEFFSGFVFATSKVASITAMIYFHIIFLSAVHTYDFHIFITLTVFYFQFGVR